MLVFITMGSGAAERVTASCASAGEERLATRHAVIRRVEGKKE